MSSISVVHKAVHRWRKRASVEWGVPMSSEDEDEDDFMRAAQLDTEGPWTLGPGKSLDLIQNKRSLGVRNTGLYHEALNASKSPSPSESSHRSPQAGRSPGLPSMSVPSFPETKSESRTRESRQRPQDGKINLNLAEVGGSPIGRSPSSNDAISPAEAAGNYLDSPMSSPDVFARSSKASRYLGESSVAPSSSVTNNSMMSSLALQKYGMDQDMNDALEYRLEKQQKLESEAIRAREHVEAQDDIRRRKGEMEEVHG